MKILFLEPFYGGSHKDFAQGLVQYSCHDIDVISLPPRFWKWRMRGAALEFARKAGDLKAYDLVFATDMLDLTDFIGFAGSACPPVIFYFHENQLSYPLAPGEKRDFHLGFTNIVSAGAADLVLFNSEFHRDDFFGAARSLIQKMPDTRPGWILKEIEHKTRVLYPGCRFPAQWGGIPDNGLDRPLVVWNHRWEYDKNPDLFFDALARLRQNGLKFYLAVMGEGYDTAPGIFDRAKKLFRSEILVWGFQASAGEYRNWLARGDVVVSTAVQENFGISVIEAVAHGCFPVLPRRLSYPELIPDPFHAQVIYEDQAGLEKQLARALTCPDRCLPARRALAAHARQFSWETQIHAYDRVMAAAASGTK